MTDQARQDGIVRLVEQAYLLVTDKGLPEREKPEAAPDDQGQAFTHLLVALDLLCQIAREEGDQALFMAIGAVGTRANGAPLRFLAAQAVRELVEAGWAFDEAHFPSAFRDEDEDEED